LADIDELKKNCTLDESFFEKFFNYTISLVTVDFEEIISNLDEISAEASDLRQEINKILKQLDNSIEKAEKEPFLYIHDYQKRKEYKENRIRSIKEDKERLIQELSNPRRVRKVTEYYERLFPQVNQQQFNCSSEKTEAVSMLLKKVDYKKQLALLSIIYGLYNNEFIWMQQNGIYSYISNFSDRCKLAESTNEKIHSVDLLIENEWCFLRQHSSDFRIQEALRFVNCVLIDIDELVNISNGYNSFEEKRISIIKSGKLPNDISFPNLVEMIYTATYNNMKQREDFIKSVFMLFAKDIGTKSVDDSFELFENNGIRNFFSSDTPVLQIFSEIFCTDTCRLANTERKKISFISFAQVYMWRNVNICSRYFLPVSSSERVSNDAWNNASEKVLAHDNCKDMLNAYCETCESNLEFSYGKPNIEAIQRLKDIIAKVSEKYSELGMAECLDVSQVHEDVEKLVKEITYLFKIEQFINKCNETAEQDTFNLRGLTINDLSQSIDTLYSELCEEIEYNRSHDIQGLLQFICNNECSITQDA
jgi:DNA integrity scanning protein DisA with diadenylate cyclase activity